MPAVDQFPTIRHLKCTVKAVHIKSFGGQKGGSSEPLEPPLATGLIPVRIVITSNALASRQVSVLAVCYVMKLDRIVRGMMDVITVFSS